MIDFCHGQAHRSNNHHHLIVIGNKIEDLLSIFQIELPDELSEGYRYEFEMSDHHFTCWLLTPEFSHPSIIRRLLRTANGLILHYSQQSIDELETWHNQFSPQVPTISVIDEFTVIEKMNQLFGTLTSSIEFKDKLLELLKDD